MSKSEGLIKNDGNYETGNEISHCLNKYCVMIQRRLPIYCLKLQFFCLHCSDMTSFVHLNKL